MNLLNTAQLSEKLGLSEGALHQLRRRETSFPAPIKVSPKILRWDENDIERWLTIKKKESNHEYTNSAEIESV
jgi:predicted DNA-binding transcriptional regulator AlpA